MTETLRSVLCGEKSWCWDSDWANVIKFNEDNTGELHCRVEFSVFIGAEFDWRSIDTSLDQVVDTRTKTYLKGPMLLKQYNIEITLSKRVTHHFRSGPLRNAKINESRLTDDAFEPRVYAVRLEKGHFITPCDAKARVTTALTEHFALRLLFDKSPYPPRDEWKEPEGGPDANQFWDWKEFAGRKSSQLATQATVEIIDLLHWQRQHSATNPVRVYWLATKNNAHRFIGIMFVADGNDDDLINLVIAG